MAPRLPSVGQGSPLGSVRDRRSETGIKSPIAISPIGRSTLAGGGSSQTSGGRLRASRGRLLVEVEVARRTLLEPETLLLGRLAQEVRGLLEHVVHVVLGLGILVVTVWMLDKLLGMLAGHLQFERFLGCGLRVCR